MITDRGERVPVGMRRARVWLALAACVLLAAAGLAALAVYRAVRSVDDRQYPDPFAMNVSFDWVRTSYNISVPECVRDMRYYVAGMTGGLILTFSAERECTDQFLASVNAPSTPFLRSVSGIPEATLLHKLGWKENPQSEYDLYRAATGPTTTFDIYVEAIDGVAGVVVSGTLGD